MCPVIYLALTSLICFTDFFMLSYADREMVYSQRLKDLRSLMGKYNISAYIIPNEDDHQSEVPALRDKRREYISGFTGTAGNALITLQNATLWTDGRYYIQAEEQLPSMWTLIRKPLILDMKNWLKENLQGGERIGIDPKKIMQKYWKEIEEFLNENNIELVALDNNLVDEIWEDQPGYSKEPLFIHDIKYCGEAYESKLQRLRQEMIDTKTDLLVVTALDEIAWLFNLRGHDVPYSPLFISYALIKLNSATLFIESEKITTVVKEHLNKTEAEVKIKAYNQFWNEMIITSQSANKTFISSMSSHAIHSKIPENRTYTKVSPLLNMKAVKNEIEVEGSRRAHIRDSIAICSLFKLMEEEIAKGIQWDELKVGQVLDELRKEYGKELYKGPSFKTQAAFGAHSAMPHYSCQPNTNVEINTSAPLTLDSGGQYLDGTIDTTRVVHFGEPTEFHKSIYTALLEGVVDLGDTIFPDGIPIESMEILARRPLLKLGSIVPHGIVHGTGIFSNVHEGSNRTYFQNFIGSQEPGFYLKDHFGMRLENLVVVVKSEVQNENNPKTLLAFSPLTLVPYEQKLMNSTLLDFRQISWINNYHEMVKQYVGNEMIKLGKQDLYNWLSEKTKPLSKRNK